MAEKLTQDKRIAKITTPLGKDVVVVDSFHGTEGLGELFRFKIDVLSEEKNIDFDKVIGQACTVKLEAYKGKERFFNGILTRARWEEKKDDFFKYQMVLRPWFYLLDYRADDRIFLKKEVKDILSKVFSDAGFNDFEFRLSESYHEIPYCVQYRETDYTFCMRLMEEFGIYFFFEHSESKHTMVLADSPSSLKKNPDVPKLPYKGLIDDQLADDQYLGNWIIERRFRTGKVEHNDYDYLKPGKKLRAPKEASEKYTHSKFEFYHYPGRHDEQDKGDKFAKIRLEAEQADDKRRFVEGNAASLFPGSFFNVEKHPLDSENAEELLVVRAEHEFSLQSFKAGGGGDARVYHGEYELQPKQRPFRMPHITPRPRIYGVQTAIVVGKDGEGSEEISTDENGHIWVQFYWDREPKKSCPARVSQVWAGKHWGFQFIPRVGMEVVVEFLDGDPDRPLVTGCVYNGDNMYPYSLPGNKTQSGIKTDSSKGHHGFNELRFEDKKGSEEIWMHAEKDHNVRINNDQTGSIGNNRTWKIEKGDDTLEIEMGDQNIKLDLGCQNTRLEVGNQNIKMDIGLQNVDALTGINLNVFNGLSSIQITPASITLTSPIINLNAMGLINLTAPMTMIPGGAVMIVPGPLFGFGLVLPPLPA